MTSLRGGHYSYYFIEEETQSERSSNLFKSPSQQVAELSIEPGLSYVKGYVPSKSLGFSNPYWPSAKRLTLEILESSVGIMENGDSAYWKQTYIYIGWLVV